MGDTATVETARALTRIQAAAPQQRAPRIVTLVVDLDDLHGTITESIGIALAATGHRIVDAAGSEDPTKARELGRNAAAALVLFAEEG